LVETTNMLQRMRELAVQSASDSNVTAWSRPLICEVIFEAMARPAASSLALLMRTPVDSLSIEVDMVRSFATSAFFCQYRRYVCVNCCHAFSPELILNVSDFLDLFFSMH